MNIPQYEKFTARAREENTPEYKKFKEVSQEDAVLIAYLQNNFKLTPEDKVLDVGGREGYISLAVQQSASITIIDPDPTLQVLDPEIIHLDIPLQNYSTESKFKLIICSHVLGDFGRGGIQEEMINKLLSLLAPDGHLVLCYNSNKGFMETLLEFSIKNLDETRYDYFDETILLSRNDLEIKNKDFSVQLEYVSFETLARCCWVLFGTSEQDINEISRSYISFLRENLENPSFILEERILDISR
jgi:hypothetical protein